MQMTCRRLNLHFVFALGLSFLTSSASAVTSWQGPYVGGFLGGAFGNHHVYTNVGTLTDDSYFTTADDIGAVNNAGTFSKKPSSLIAGIQAGHDWMWQQIVYGLAFDYSVLPLQSAKTTTVTYPDNPDQFSIYTTASANRLFTFRGRVGYQAMVYLPSFFYITGGFALTQLKVNNNFSDNSAFSGVGASQTSKNQIGWTIGAGLELLTFAHASVDFQYLYLHFPSVKTTGFITNTQGGFGVSTGTLTSPFATTDKFHANLFSVGLNYRFEE